MTDADLIAALRQHEESALEAAIRQYSGYVMAVVQHTLGSGVALQDKEELVSDVFVSLWKNAGALRPGSPLKPWLAVVARNAAINKLHALHPTSELSDDMLAQNDSMVTGPVERREQSQLVRQAVDGLGEEDRMLFVRHYYWHQSIADISKDTGMNESTIKSRLFRGRKVLKAALTQRGYAQ